MIDEHNSMRIADDACIACDALKSLIVAAPYIHEDYLHEKLEVVRRCLRFMESFEPEE